MDNTIKKIETDNLNIYNSEDYRDIESIIKGSQNEEESIRMIIESNDSTNRSIINQTSINTIINNGLPRGEQGEIIQSNTDTNDSTKRSISNNDINNNGIQRGEQGEIIQSNTDTNENRNTNVNSGTSDNTNVINGSETNDNNKSNNSNQDSTPDRLIVNESVKEKVEEEDIDNVQTNIKNIIQDENANVPDSSELGSNSSSSAPNTGLNSGSGP